MERVSNWLIIALIVSVCASCSIEKRHFNGGYYIKWHKRYKGTENEAKVEKEIDTVSTEILPDSSLAEVEDQPVFEPEIDSVFEEPQKVKREKLPDLPREERRFEPLGVLAFKILCSNVIVGLIGDHLYVPKQVVRYELLFTLIMLVSLILGIISMIRYLRNPRHYRFNFFAIIAILVPVIFFMLLIAGDISIGWKYLLPKYW